MHALARDGLRARRRRLAAVAGATHEVEAADETDLVFEGLCAFADPPKATAAAAIARLAAAGIRLKILSGDDPVVVKRLAGLVGLNADKVLSGDRCRCAQRRRAGGAGPVGRRLSAGWRPTRSPVSSRRLQAQGRGRRLSRRRHQRCAGAEGRRHRTLGRRRHRRGASRRRHDPARVRPGGRRRRRRGRPANLRQHPEICAHGRQLEFRQHAVDGGGVACACRSCRCCRRRSC